jgi:hypothetical protein
VRRLVPALRAKGFELVTVSRALDGRGLPPTVSAAEWRRGSIA